MLQVNGNKQLRKELDDAYNKYKLGEYSRHKFKSIRGKILAKYK
jgi:uncharacterized protein with ParB-like and HNH nuclease domain